jgi:hypothetical protein
MGRRFESCRAHDFLLLSVFVGSPLNSVCRFRFLGTKSFQKIRLEARDAFARAACSDSALVISCAYFKVSADPQDSKSEASSPVPECRFPDSLDFRAHPEHRVA